MEAQRRLIFTFAAWFCVCLVPGVAPAAAHDLQSVKGIEGFGGSPAAKEILARNGFADPG